MSEFEKFYFSVILDWNVSRISTRTRFIYKYLFGQSKIKFFKYESTLVSRQKLHHEKTKNCDFIIPVERP